MFVEIVRLLIVFMTTAGGFALGEGVVDDPDTGKILGATLGACLGYVAGGVFGRLLRVALGEVEERAEQLPAPQLLAGMLGGTAVAGFMTLVGLPAAMLVPGWVRWPVLGIAVWAGAYEGFTVAARKSEQLLAMAGLSTRPLIAAVPYAGDGPAVLLDTSAVIDGRLLSLARSGFVQGAMFVPRFVLDEVQAVADAQDPARRRRGRRGLEVLDALGRVDGVTVQVLDDEVVEHDEVDAKLVSLAMRLKVPLVTVDSPLQRVAELQGVRCLNVTRLAEGLKPDHVPGDVLRVPISKPGREAGQGVGYLDDGTMVVVADADGHVGEEVTVRVTGGSQSSVGRLLFASLVDA